MASPTTASNEPRWTTRERPWLVSWNRKLRHLRSIAIRNLTLAEPEHRVKGRVSDDDALPNTLRSPAKLLALREAKSLGHSRSSDDLRPIHESADVNGTSPVERPLESPKPSSKAKILRPGLKLRRRSTIDWASATSQSRQKRMEDVSAARLADVFFSLHVQGVDEPIYVSEVVPKTMNPTFQYITIENCGPAASRLDNIILKIWVRSGKILRYRILLEMTLSLRSLQFIGKDLASFHHPFPPNCILFHLIDGYYTCFTDAPVEEPPNPFVNTRQTIPSSRTLRTASFDALLRLSKLDDSIQDSLALRERLSDNLSAVVESNSKALTDKDHLDQSKDYRKTIQYAKSALEKQLRSLKQSRDGKHSSLKRRRELLAQGQAEITKGTLEIESSQDELSDIHADKLRLTRSITNQRRRISADLCAIYPVAAIPSKPLCFTIRDLHLPDTEAFDADTPPEHIAAALGHVAHVLQLLSFYLRRPLPYPPHPRSSTSMMTDPISSLKPTASSAGASTSPYPPAAAKPLSDPARSFPLYPRAPGPRYRFDYALFLLNKDLHVLLADAFNVRVLDIRQTLPNLMYVLACMAAGDGDLPARKAGGVRGLIRTSSSAEDGDGAPLPKGRKNSSPSMAIKGDNGGPFGPGRLLGQRGAVRSKQGLGLSGLH